MFGGGFFNADAAENLTTIHDQLAGSGGVSYNADDQLRIPVNLNSESGPIWFCHESDDGRSPQVTGKTRLRSRSKFARPNI